MSRRTYLCREGWYYLVLLGFLVGGAVMREINLLILMACMMFGILIYHWWSVVRSLRKTRAIRKLPESICAGDLLVAEVELENLSRWSSKRAVVVEDHVARHEAGRAQGQCAAQLLFGHIPAGQQRRIRYHGHIAKRGRYQFGPLRLSTRFPIGLMRRTINIDDVATLTVFPRLGHLSPAWSSIYRATLAGTHRSRRHQRTAEGDFFGLRDWRAGDSRRLIHWRSSARRRNLVVRQFEQQHQQDLSLMVDLWQSERPSTEEIKAIETAVSFAATVVNHLCRRGDSRLALGLAGKDFNQIKGTASMALLGEIMEHLSVVEADVHTRLSNLVQQGLEELPAGATALLVSTRHVDLESRETFADLPEETWLRLHRRGVVCIDVHSDRLSEFFRLDE